MHAPANVDSSSPITAARPCAGLPNGLHHLAIATCDAKAQIEFFTDVIGLELVALYWMHGVADTVHAFLRLSDTASIAFVQGPEMRHIEPQLGVSHAGFTAGPVAPGAVQHVALNVDSEDDLLAMRDRIRSRGHFVMGPIDHGMCKSIYLAAPEGLQLEFSTWTGVIDAERWIDPEVVAFCGIDTADIARYRAPAAFASQGGAVPQPDPRAKPTFVFPDEMRETGEALLAASDAEIAMALDHPEPPVPARVASSFSTGGERALGDAR
jgi:catechol 2,3-dioxygenase-like lactoylglutathione lyase family enzyme